MPRGKSTVKTTRVEGNESVNANTSQYSSDRMKDIEPATAATEEHEAGPSGKPDSVGDVGEVSVVPTLHCDKSKENHWLPIKPRRLLMITGSKKKDAKPKASGDTDTKNAAEDMKTSKADQTSQDRRDIGSDNAESSKVQDNLQDSKRKSNSDEHPYEDPGILFNNSKALQGNKNNKSSKVKKTSKKSRKKHDERPQSPAFKELAKSTESIKATVKAVKEKRPSVMSEHSGARSVFAFLVALLLALIVFLSCYFLFHSHAVLSTVLAVLLCFIVFFVLGFLDIRRIKCLVLLTIPSLCSRGGKLALYILLLYFVIQGPLCNTIGNIKSVRRSLKCANRQRSGEFEMATETFHAAQNCVINFARDTTKRNLSIQASLSCLQKSCFSVKDKLKQNCGLGNRRTSAKVCSLAKVFTCNSSNFVGNKECPKLAQTPCQEEFDNILGFLDEDGTDDGCGFLKIIGMLLPLLILLLFREAYNYEKCYRTYNSFHNYFLTGHFQCIDQSRSSCEREAVLPLRKVELRNHVRPSVCHLTDGEKKLLHGSLKTYILFLLVVLIVILVDLYTYRMFNIESSDSSNTRSQLRSMSKSKHFVKLKKNATLVSGNKTNTSNVITSSSFSQLPEESQDTCLVTVESPGSISKIVLPTLLSILLVVILLQAYLWRFQWYVCSKFYNDREKERVFYLYNKILEDRTQLVEKCQKQMKCYNREMNTLNSLEPTRVLAKQTTWISEVFKFLHINLRKCIICNDPEKATFKVCHGADCSGVYCLECSFDIDKKCLYCDTELKVSLSEKPAAGQDRSSKESLV